jgi:hypothetical protein
MNERRRLPERRKVINTDFSHNDLKYIASFGFFPDGSLSEIFVNSQKKVGNEGDINASDAAVAISLALQYGCPLETLRSAMKRNRDGSPLGPITHALDLAAQIIEGDKVVELK